MDKKVLRDIIKTKNSIRRKYRALKTGRIEAEAQLEQTFKPISSLLKELVTKVKAEPLSASIKFEPKEEVEEEYDETKTPSQSKSLEMESMSTPLKYPEYSITSEDEFATPTRATNGATTTAPNMPNNLLGEYMKLYIDKSPAIDNAHGVYLDDNNIWKMGNSVLELDGDDIIIKGKRYNATPGLYELLFMKEPDRGQYSHEDLKNYQAILKDTNAYRRNFDEHSQIKGSSSVKYKQIIKKLISPKAYKGKGLMQLPKEKIDYIYWNDPNELVDRLRLLVASQMAGNNSHNNEIVSIIEELREADIIA